MQAQIVKFDDFELDLGRYELRHHGEALKLEKVPMELLILLAERGGQLVTREEIIQRLWGPDVFVDTRQGINTAVRKIRLALQDDPDNPRILQTVFGKGYRLMKPTTAPEDSGQEPMSPPASEPGAAQAGTVESVALKERLESNSGLLPTDGAPTIVETKDEPLHGVINPHVARGLFLVIQSGYLVLYATAFMLFGNIERLGLSSYIPILILMAGLIGAPVRLYLIAAVGFRYSGSARLFRQVFPGILALDTLWAVSPLLLFEKLGYLTLLGAAALAFLPFSQRTLVLSMNNLRTGTKVQASSTEL